MKIKCLLGFHKYEKLPIGFDSTLAFLFSKIEFYYCKYCGKVITKKERQEVINCRCSTNGG